MHMLDVPIALGSSPRGGATWLRPMRSSSRHRRTRSWGVFDGQNTGLITSRHAMTCCFLLVKSCDAVFFFDVSKNLEVEQKKISVVSLRSIPQQWLHKPWQFGTGRRRCHPPVICWTARSPKGIHVGNPMPYTISIYTTQLKGYFVGIVFCCFHMDEGERDIPNDPKLFVGKVTTIFGVLKMVIPLYRWMGEMVRPWP